MESTICHFEIPADDLASAREFYGKLFGWEATAAGEEYLLLKTSEQPDALAGALFKRGTDGRGVTLYVLVESVEDAAKKLEDLGGKLLVPRTAVPGMGWTVLGQDPQGSPVGLFEQDADAA